MHVHYTIFRYFDFIGFRLTLGLIFTGGLTRCLDVFVAIVGFPGTGGLKQHSQIASQMELLLYTRNTQNVLQIKYQVNGMQTQDSVKGLLRNVNF